MIVSVLFVVNAFDKNLVVREYRIRSQKIKAPLDLVILSELHGSNYGTGQTDLIEKIRSLDPDGIVLLGDLLDRRSSWSDFVALLDGIADLAPTFFVTGNHEIWTEKVYEIKALVRSYGIQVLEGDCVFPELSGQRLQVCGTDDPRVYSGYMDQVRRIVAEGAVSEFSVLLSHRPDPEIIQQFEANQFELILSGHTHGGQWRIPGLFNGLYAPGQGLFPRYSGGLYPLRHGSLIVSRGLTQDSFGFPRLFNPPELVLVWLEG